MIIRSKKEFFDLWKAGVLGNRTLLSEDLDEALSWNTKHIGFREIGKAGGGKWELATRDDAPKVFAQWKSEYRQFIMDGGVPNDKSTMQGEVCRTELGLQSFLCVRDELMQRYYVEAFDGTELVLALPGLPPMRRTIAAGWHRHRHYLETRMLLARYMDPSSRDDLDMLLEQYPDATVEFTCFSVNVGVFPHRNTIFWEVRNY